MSLALPERAGPPVGPRLLHLVVLLGFAAATLFVIGSELSQLAASQRAPYHFGDPPRGLALLAGVLLVPSVGMLAWCFSRGRPAPRWASGVVVGAAVLALVSMGLGDVPQGRTWAAADTRILQMARGLQDKMLERLKVQEKLPVDEAVWAKALAEVPGKPSPVRTRSFEPVPYRLVLQREQGKVPGGLAPGAIAVWIRPSGDYFELTPVGFGRDGSVGPLRDEAGEPVVLKGGVSPTPGGSP